MPVERDAVKSLLQPSPQDEQFAAAALTQQLYNEVSGGLSGIERNITSNIYGRNDRFDPSGVVEGLERYLAAVNKALETADEVVKKDSLLGPGYRSMLKDKSAHYVTLKNMVLGWLSYMQDKATFAAEDAKVQKADAEKTEATTEEYLPKLEELVQRFHKIGS